MRLQVRGNRALREILIWLSDFLNAEPATLKDPKRLNWAGRGPRYASQKGYIFPGAGPAYRTNGRSEKPLLLQEKVLCYCLSSRSFRPIRTSS